MKKSLLVFAVLIVAMALSSCSTLRGYTPGTSAPRSDSYEVLGEVERVYNNNVILGFINFGDNEIGMKDQLMAQNTQADDVINISVEERSRTVLLIIYRQQTFILKGTAIKYTG